VRRGRGGEEEGRGGGYLDIGAGFEDGIFADHDGGEEGVRVIGCRLGSREKSREECRVLMSYVGSAEAEFGSGNVTDRIR
jgi:hypothetical protein